MKEMLKLILDKINKWKADNRTVLNNWLFKNEHIFKLYKLNFKIKQVYLNVGTIFKICRKQFSIKTLE